MSIDRVLEKKLEGLYARRNAGIKFGLNVQQDLMRRLGDPQQRYAVVHVAGTNGKGSVCAMVSTALRCAGFRVGLYTSPHLVEFNERISIDGAYASDDELLRISEMVDRHTAAVEEKCGRPVTFFEYSTAMAMELFAQRGVQVAVLETGMGGRLDATNIVTPLVSVITRISIEHTDFLGDTIEAIAGEKAGIIKKGRPVVCGTMPEEAMEVMCARAAEMGAMLRNVEETVSVRLLRVSLLGQEIEISTDTREYGRMSSRLIGEHQLENCATAAAAVEEIERAMGVEFGADAVRDGIEKAEWPGRFQVLSQDPPVILDGAHNPGASLVLGRSLKKVLGRKPIGLVVGMCSDKDIPSFFAGFKGVVRVWAVKIRNERSIPAEDLAVIARGRGFQCEALPLKEALRAAEDWAKSAGGAVCIAGSLFLAGEVLEMRGK
jgi:dihydrofolate synthase/folylpolyglutamate synthase